MSAPKPNPHFGPSYHRSGRVQIERHGSRLGLVVRRSAAAALDDLEIPRLEVTLAPSAEALIM